MISFLNLIQLKQGDNMNNKPDVAKCLERAKELFAERNTNYKDTWLKVGEIEKILFDKAVFSSTSAFTKFQIVNMIIGKITRYVESGMQHQDSADDLVAYSAMLAAITETSNKGQE